MAIDLPRVRLSDLVHAASQYVVPAVSRRAVSLRHNLVSGADSLAQSIDRRFRDRLEGRARTFAERALGFDFRDSVPFVPRTVEKLLGSEHTAYNVLGLAQTMVDIAASLMHYASIVGVREFMQAYKTVGSSLDRLSVHPEFAPYAQLHYQHWIEDYAKIHGLSVRFENTELVPQEGPAVYAVFCHSSIFPDFFLPYLDPRGAFVADAYNFRDNPVSRRFGFSLMGDLFGQPLVDRKDPARNEKLFDHIIDVSARHGIRPIWFPNGTRVPRAWKDDGTLDRAGFYSSAPNAKNAKHYLQAGGVAVNAVRLAKKVGRTVKVVVVTIQGPEYVMPKSAGKPPFIQPTRLRGDIVHRFVQVIEVSPDSKERQVITDLGRNLHLQAKADLGIDEYLVECVGRWSGSEQKAKAFAEKAKNGKGEIWFILADRIRAIHPSLPERAQFIQRLLEAVDILNPNGALDTLLEEVTAFMMKHQFDAH